MNKSYLSSLKRLLSGVMLIVVLGLSLAPIHTVLAVGNPVEVFGGLKAFGGTDPCKGQDASQCYQLLEPFGSFNDKNEPVEVTAIGLDATQTIGTTFNNIYFLTIGLASLLGVLLIAWYGFQYMRSDDNVSKKGVLKDKITNVVIGLLLLVSIYVILNTINPQLLDVQPDLADVSLIPNRNEDPNFVETVTGLDTTGIVITEASYNDPTFLAYLAHQQGPGGAPAILWSVKNKLASVPSNNPYAKFTTGKKGDINLNMAGNAPIADVRKVTGQSTLTPAVFIQYWAKKVEAAKKQTTPIPEANKTGIKFASEKSGLPIEMLTAMCRIESSCKDPNITNSYGYNGLFQLSNGVFNLYSKYFAKPNIFDALQNSYAGAMYAKENLTKLQAQIKKM